MGFSKVLMEFVRLASSYQAFILGEDPGGESHAAWTMRKALDEFWDSLEEDDRKEYLAFRERHSRPSHPNPSIID